MPHETPKFAHAQEGAEEKELTPEMSPEDFEEMMGQIPALKEMLAEREEKLKELEKNPDDNMGRIQNILIEITELQAEITAREEVL